ncbi:hypothetical protein [Paenibacillus rhizophilus]|uniref:hypothetical protein n=1 Tax=Paenibacillus rhizophilus TaxID=1850366 RepID=UPI00163B0855|nr:hypothetical protein [Paenibacillus rhizophilus]
MNPADEDRVREIIREELYALLNKGAGILKPYPGKTVMDARWLREEGQSPKK